VAEAHDRGRDHHDRGRNNHHEHWGRREPVVRVQVGPRYERPASRVWVPGYWGWRGPRRMWIAGSWAMPPQPGLVWMPARWVWSGYTWVWQDGYWAPAPY